MATTDYRTATTSPRNAQTAINRPSGDRNEVSSTNGNTAVWIIVAIVALAAIAFAMGLFGSADTDEQSAAPTMATETYAPADRTDTQTNVSPMAPANSQPGTPDATQTNMSPSAAPGAVENTNPAPAATAE